MKFISVVACILLAQFAFAQPGKYAGSKKSLIGKVYTDSRDLTALKGWTMMEGGVANSLDDPEMITSNVFKKGTTYVVFFSIKEDTASDTYTVMDVVEITGVLKGWTVRGSFCRQNEQVDNYIMAWGKENKEEFMKLIKKAWKFNRDKRRIEAIPVKGIDCENIGC